MKHCPRCGVSGYPDEANFCPACAGRLQVVASEPAPDPALLEGRFALGAQVGGRYTGAIFEAEDVATRTACLIKFIAPAVLPSPAHVQQALRELAALSSSQHPSIARILGSGQRGEQVWVACERVPGVPLSQWLSERGLVDSDTAAAWVIALARGLDDAGRRGVFHRDLSAKNVLCNGSRVWLINFCAPVPGNPPGMVEFLPPEALSGRAADQLATIYSLGLLYTFMRTGRTTPDAAALETHLGLRAVIARACQREPTSRFMTLAQFADELSAALAAPPGAVSPMLANASGAIPRGAAANLAPPFDPTLPVSALPQTYPARGPSGVVAAVAPVARPATGQQRAASAQPVTAQARVPSQTGGGASKRGDGKFRETLWFKKGELDAQAANTAARPDSRGLPGLDKADEMPIEDRYSDDGTLNESDRRNYSLQTGATQGMPAMRNHPTGASGAVSTDELIGEMRSGRGKILLFIGLGIAIVAGIVILTLAL